MPPAAPTSAATATDPLPPGRAIDPLTGLVKAENWELVRANCTACHSAQLIIQQRASRASWLDMIRWMQATQGLWPFDARTEARILDYLARHYPPTGSWRRMPLPVRLRPPDPYSSGLPVDAESSTS